MNIQIICLHPVFVILLSYSVCYAESNILVHDQMPVKERFSIHEAEKIQNERIECVRRGI